MNVRIALVGAGIMGADHAQLLAEAVPHAELAIVCDASRERAGEIAARFGVPHVLTDPTDAVTSDAVDAVVIASPDDTHAPLTLAALEAGKHVLCEKPLSPSSEECLAVMELEQRIGERRVQVGFMRRFDPAYAEMKAHLLNGAVGPAVMLHCFHRNVKAPANFVGRMAITNSAPHEFDAARHLLDDEIAAISVFQPEVRLQSTTAMPVCMVLRTRRGRLVNIEVNNNAGYGYDVRAELVGERGSVFLRAPVHSEVHADLRAGRGYPADWRPRFAQAYLLQDRAWIAAIRSGTPSSIAADCWDGYCAARVAEAGVLALAGGNAEAVSLIEQPALYRAARRSASQA